MRVSGPIACIALYAALYTAFGVGLAVLAEILRDSGADP
jgi:hypothetical protein